ncbi:PqqD family protein [Longimonas halophila]|uniref:PqqD family protein n=1 Tax=Longimonas halophila TaxID=1469170 RepID=A0A2H3NPB1_9BACT|nr:PqqD family protein [Longimonas halophila]PEN08856.1 PqqD family protein [Longimonas halophila]
MTDTSLTPDALTDDTLVRASDTHVSSDLAGEEVILNLSNGVYYGLNPVGSQIWALIQTPQPVADLCAALQDTYPDVDPEVLGRDVRALLIELHEAELLTVVDEAA